MFFAHFKTPWRKRLVHDKYSVNTIIKSISHHKEAYIIEGSLQYSAKVKRERYFYEKIYNEHFYMGTTFMYLTTRAMKYGRVLF